jgi:hypothetical protein
MKKIVLFFSMVALSTCGLCQSVETIDWPLSVNVPEDEVQYEVAVDVTNTGSSDVVVRVSSEAVSIVGTADYRFCWGPTCYNWTQGDFTSPASDALMVTIAPGATNSSFYTDYRHDMNFGSSVINYCWFDNNNPSDEACYELTWTLGTVGLEEAEVSAELSGVSPNPVQGTSSIAYNVQGGGNNIVFVVYNLVGEVVHETVLNNPMGLLFVSADDFQSGVYLTSLIVDGEIYSTKKMLVSK